MKYYIGYFNKPWDLDEFTVICATPNKHSADFIFSKYKEHDPEGDTYILLSAANIMDKRLVF